MVNKDRERNNFLFLSEAEYWIDPFGFDARIGGYFAHAAKMIQLTQKK